MNPLEPRPAIVQAVQDPGRKNCTDLFDLVKKHDERATQADKTALETFVALGHALSSFKLRTTHGQWGTTLDEMGIPRRTASEAMRFSTLDSDPTKRHVIAELGSKRAVRDYLEESPLNDDCDEICGVEADEADSNYEQIGGAPDLQKAGGQKVGKSRSKGKKSRPDQPELPSPEDEQERLEGRVRDGLLAIAAALDEQHENLSQLLGCETKVGEEFRRLARLSGHQFEVVDAESKAAWRAMQSAVRLLQQAGATR